MATPAWDWSWVGVREREALLADGLYEMRSLFRLRGSMDEPGVANRRTDADGRLQALEKTPSLIQLSLAKSKRRSIPFLGDIGRSVTVVGGRKRKFPLDRRSPSVAIF